MSPLSSPIGMSLVWDFDLYVAVRTKDTKNKADERYAAQASARWTFRAVGATNQMPGAATVQAPTGWTAMPDGSQSQIKLGPVEQRFNNLVNDQQWAQP